MNLCRQTVFLAPTHRDLERVIGQGPRSSVARGAETSAGIISGRTQRALFAVQDASLLDHSREIGDLGFSCPVVLFQIRKTGDELKSERLLIDCQVINLIEGNISVAFEIGSTTR
jgi:hypothetical protein